MRGQHLGVYGVFPIATSPPKVLAQGMGIFRERGNVGLLDPGRARITEVRAQRARYIAVLVAAVSSCVAGTALAVLPPDPAIALTAAAGISSLLFGIRLALRPARTPREQPRGFAEVEVEGVRGMARRTFAESRGLARSRAVYYLGAATMGLLTIRPALSFTLSDWLFLLSFGLTALVILQARKVVGLDLPPLVFGGVALFAVGGFVSSVHAFSPLGSAAVVVRVLYLTIPWFWLGTVLLRTPAHVQLAVTAWVVSAAVSSAGAVAQFFLGDVIPGGNVAWGRATGFTPQVNSLGGLTAVALVPSLMVAAQSKGWVRAFAYAITTLIAAGLLLSGSVGGLLAAAISTAVWLVASRRARQTLAVLSVLVVATVLLFGGRGRTDSPALFHRFSKVTQSDAPRSTGGTLYSRIDVYRSAWNEIRDQPFVGVGLDAASSTQRVGFQVHNIALQPWYTAGILGVLGIFILFGSLAHAGFRVVLRAETARERRLALALYASFLAFVIDALSEPILYVRYGWVPVAFLLALRAQQRRQAKCSREDRLVAESDPRARTERAVALAGAS